VGVADDEAGVGLLDGLGRREAAFGQGSTLLLPIDDPEHQLQVLCDPRSSALMHFRDDASAAQRAAGVRCLILHALAFSCARKISSQSASARSRNMAA
jgi:hypothetical protein